MANHWLAAGRYRWQEATLKAERGRGTVLVRAASESHKRAKLYKLQELWVSELGEQEWRDVMVAISSKSRS